MSKKTLDVADALRQAHDNRGDNIWDMSQEQRVLVVFLRHFGCTFCRQAVDDIQRIKTELDDANVELVFVHMGEDERGDQFFETRGLPDARHVADPQRELYRAFSLQRGSWLQLLGPTALLQGIKAGIIEQHGIGRSENDVRQMPGLFLIEKGKISAAFRHKHAGDRPNYLDFAGVWDDQRKKMRDDIKSRMQRRRVS